MQNLSKVRNYGKTRTSNFEIFPTIVTQLNGVLVRVIPALQYLLMSSITTDVFLRVLQRYLQGIHQLETSKS